MSPSGQISNLGKLAQALEDYADLLEPWAEAVANYMLADVYRRDYKMWKQNSADMGRELRRELESAPTGELLKQLQREQVRLITSLPREAAQRVHNLSQTAMLQSTRASELTKAILDTENVTAGRARMIARTEVSRVQANLVEARASYAGSEGYLWRTSTDSDVRESHAEMEGKYVRWSEPPTLDGLTGHAGTLPNCRCFAEPTFPDD